MRHHVTFCFRLPLSSATTWTSSHHRATAQEVAQSLSTPCKQRACWPTKRKQLPTCTRSKRLVCLNLKLCPMSAVHLRAPRPRCGNNMKHLLPREFVWHIRSCLQYLNNLQKWYKTPDLMKMFLSSTKNIHVLLYALFPGKWHQKWHDKCFGFFLSCSPNFWGRYRKFATE